MPLLRDQLFARVALESGFTHRTTVERAFAAAGAGSVAALMRDHGVLTPDQCAEVERRFSAVMFACPGCQTALLGSNFPFHAQSVNCPRCGTLIADLMRLHMSWVQQNPQPQAYGQPNPAQQSWAQQGYGSMAGHPAPSVPQSQRYSAQPQQQHQAPPPKQSYKDLVGTSLGGFAIEKFLGKGAHGWVFKAAHPKANFPLAIKVVPQAVAAQNPVILKRLEREATILRGVNHPNLVRIFGHGRERGFHFLAMEFIEGTTLNDIMAEWGDEPNLGQGLTLFRQLLSGLARAHEHGVIHRDLKPDNIMVRTDGTVKIMDFGLAREDESESEDETPGLTMQGEILGTPHYMSPEQAEAETIDLRADIYAAGATFYHVFTGGVPFDDKRVVRIIRAHMNKTPDSPKERNPKVSNELSEILLKMLKKKPADRYQSCAEILQAIKPLGGDEPATQAAAAVPDKPRCGLDFPEPGLLLLIKEGLNEGWLSQDRVMTVLEQSGKLLRLAQLLRQSGYVPADIDQRISAARIKRTQVLDQLEAEIAVISRFGDPDRIRALEGSSDGGSLARRLASAGIIDEARAEQLETAAKDNHWLIEDMVLGKMAVRDRLVDQAKYNDMLKQRRPDNRFEDLILAAGIEEDRLANTKRDAIRYLLTKKLPQLKVQPIR